MAGEGLDTALDGPTESKTPEGGGVYLFVSVDMANSTEFKNRERRWPFVIHHFYESVVTEMKSVCPLFNVWKYIGDEVTFWRRVSHNDNLVHLIKEAHRALQDICGELEQIEVDHGIKTKNLISAKMTVWIAAADFVKGADLERDLSTNYNHANRVIEEDHIVSLTGNSINAETKIYDFVGPEIDIGFRISHFAQRGFLLLSAGLAHLLLHQSKTTDEIGKHMKIVAYETLKGVWGGRKYPIVWYTDSWDNVQSKFYYDERLSNPVIASICRNQLDDISLIEAILTQTNHLDTMASAREWLSIPAS